MRGEKKPLCCFSRERGGLEVVIRRRGGDGESPHQGFRAVAGVRAALAWWVGCCSSKGKAVVPNQGTRLGCEPGPWLGACKGQLIDVSLAHQCFSPSLSPSHPLSLKINK